MDWDLKASAAIGFIKVTKTSRKKLTSLKKSLAILEKASISLKKSSKIFENLIKTLHF
jgi:hypothetical protein